MCASYAYSQCNESGTYYSIYKKQSKAKLRTRFKLEASQYHVKNGDKVLDLGGNDGSLIIPLSIVCDSLDYYLEDIHDTYFPMASETLSLAKQKLNPNIAYQIHTILGNDTAINLLGIYFDKIIVRETFHHFSNPSKILNEVKRLLAYSGELKIIEPTDHVKFKHCHLIEPDKLISILTAEEFRYISTFNTSDMIIFTFQR